MILVRDLQQRMLRLAAVLSVSCMGACGGGTLASAVSGSYVVFESGNVIIAEPYQP